MIPEEGEDDVDDSGNFKPDDEVFVDAWSGREAIKVYRLSIDVVTRWGSIFMMMQRLLVLRVPIE